MRRLKPEDLEALVDFIYFGEATVLQENLEAFVSVATELNLKGLDFGENRSNDNISQNSESTFSKAAAVEYIEVAQNTKEVVDIYMLKIGHWLSDELVNFECDKVLKQDFEAAGDEGTIESAKNSEEVDWLLLHALLHRFNY